MAYHFSPSEFNFLRCKRCYYLKKVRKIEFTSSFPEVFTALDISQKKYFLSKKTDTLSKELPEGRFYNTVTKDERNERKKNNLPELNELEIPAKIYSRNLKDNKDRIFTLGGIPDLVVKFATNKEDKYFKDKPSVLAYAYFPNNQPIGGAFD